MRALLLLAALALSSCATSRQVELEFRVRELEQALIWAQEDNTDLLRALHEYERGLEIQAEIIRKLDRNCET